MGTPYFYMEFLVAMVSLLAERGFHNPAVFAPQYTLVPDACYPTQADQVERAYAAVLDRARHEPDRVIVAGDSAGANLVLGLLLRAAAPGSPLPRPLAALLLSPWTTLVSPLHRDTASDYLGAARLHRFGLQYAGGRGTGTGDDAARASPGRCKDPARWRRAAPAAGFFVAYGAEEVLAAEIDALVRVWARAAVPLCVKRRPAGIHAWTVASLFLARDRARRLEGLEDVATFVRHAFDEYHARGGRERKEESTLSD